MNLLTAAQNNHCRPRLEDVKRRKLTADAPQRMNLMQPSHLNVVIGGGGKDSCIQAAICNSRQSLGIDDIPYQNRDLAQCQALYFSWREAEARVPAASYNLSFKETNEVERIRLASIESIFNYVLKKGLSQSTIHLAVLYTNRLFHYHVVENAPSTVPEKCLFTAVAAALRMAVKMHERWENTEAFRLCPDQLWRISKMGENCKHYQVDKSVELLNQMERLHFRVLGEDSAFSPVACDFLEHYLFIGGWPAHSVSQYRHLSLFLLALSLFSTGADNALSGVMPSKLAAAALVLTVKIINADQQSTAYEFWTEKLEAFSQYTLKELQPVVHALSRILRSRQEKVKSEVFTAMFPEWSKFSWS